MISILRQPDYVFGATESSPFRFEEAASKTNDVKFDYKLEGASARVTVYPSESPVKYLKLRFEGDNSSVYSVYGDQWERSSDGSLLEWRSIMPHRPLPWFCYVKSAEGTACYGVKTGADCFAYFNVDERGVTLFLNLMSGSHGVDLKEPLVACEVVEAFSLAGESDYALAKRFAAQMIDKPLLPKRPIFGVNNWYWAYGRISRESIREETDYLMRACEGVKNSPYMILDDGWQINRTYGKGAYIGGPWLPNDRFLDMAATADEIKARGATPGIWFRPLLTIGDILEEAKLKADAGGVVLDPSHPYTLERVERDAGTLRGWGFELIKHDFTTFDTIGWNTKPEAAINGNADFFDKTKTTATILKNLYRAIARGASGADVIACNAVGHLTAGIHSIYRTGGDTSGRSFEWTRRNGVNTFLRLPLNDLFYKADPDCAAFTERVDLDLNLDFLEVCAITGMTTLASITPGILSTKQLDRINGIFRIADEDKLRYEIKNFGASSSPESFLSPDGKTERRYDWEKAYHGARSILDWMN